MRLHAQLALRRVEAGPQLPGLVRVHPRVPAVPRLPPARHVDPLGAEVAGEVRLERGLTVLRSQLVVLAHRLRHRLNCQSVDCVHVSSPGADGTRSPGLTTREATAKSTFSSGATPRAASPAPPPQTPLRGRKQAPRARDRDGLQPPSSPPT